MFRWGDTVGIRACGYASDHSDIAWTRCEQGHQSQMLERKETQTQYTAVLQREQKFASEARWHFEQLSVGGIGVGIEA